MRIGLFDSGVGGFTVIKMVAKLHLNISFVYLADTARLPYGVKSHNEIIQIADEISSWFSNQKIDALLVACNTTNAVALNVIKNKLDIPVFDLIESASSIIQESRVGVIATPSTVKTKAYTKAILDFKPTAFVVEQSCPRFVPMIEKDKIRSDEILAVAIDYLRPILDQKIESLILGCSHYPLITPLLLSLLPTDFKLIDPAEALSLRLKSFVGTKLINAENREYSFDSKFYVTADPKKFAKKVEYWLNVFPEVNLVSLPKKGWVS